MEADVNLAFMRKSLSLHLPYLASQSKETAAGAASAQEGQ